MNNKGWSRKIYLELPAPSEEDHCSLQERLLAALAGSDLFCADTADGSADSGKSIEPHDPGADAAGNRAPKIRIRPDVLGEAADVCAASDWRVTATLAFDGYVWELLYLEGGDTAGEHYGLCADLGSTTIIMEVLDLDTGEVKGEASIFNPEIKWGEDILSRIFYTMGNPGRRKELQEAVAAGFAELMGMLKEKTGIDTYASPMLTVAGNTTMIHFLLGLDAFGVFQSPHAVQTLSPDIVRAQELGIPMKGFVLCCPAMENYLGGDIVSGMIATGIPDMDEISVFLDVGTNGELVVGNKDFLLAGAGAAGPALEGASVHTGMRAVDGAVDIVTTEYGVADTVAEECGAADTGTTGKGACMAAGNGVLKCHVLGECEARGICGSGIVDLISEIYLNGVIDLRGRFQEGVRGVVSIHRGDDLPDELGIEYAPGLFFGQSDVDEFLKAKAAAMTMVEYMMNLIGLTMDDVGRFYVAGAFGTHIDKESAVTIGMYPDIDRDKIISPGNTSLLGAEKLLLDRAQLTKAEEIIGRMQYVQFGAVEDFIQIMAAAQAIPHTDLQRFPSVMRRLEERRQMSVSESE